MKKGLVFTALIAAFGIGLAACGQTPAAPKEYVVTIANKTALQEEWKDTPEDFRTAAVTIKGKNHDEVVDFYEAVDAGDLKFTSSETSVLTVAGYGIITCQGAGKSTITATYKNEFSDSVEITVSQEEAIRPAFTLDTSKEYWLGLTPSDGITQYATGKMSSYYLATDKLSKAATATVAIDPEATDDFKYVITLSYKDGEKTESKVIGSAFNENDKGKHYNIGFVGNKVSGSDIEFVKALFKFDAQTHQFTTMVAEDATTLVECKMGTSGTYKTLQYGPVSENKVTYPAYLYEEGDPIHPETLVINGESEITLRPGFSTKLEYTCTPDFVTDNAKWSSDNMAAVTVDEGTGYVSAVGASGTSANITVKVYRKSATVKVKVQGEGLEYGTATAPLTVAQAKAQLDDLGDNGVTVFKMYVRGEISEVENYDTTYGNRNVWLKDGDTAKGFELYRLKDGETPAEVKTEDLLAGQTITAAGYATKYVTGTGDSQKITYEFTPSQGFNPQPVKVEVPQYTGFTAPESLEVAVDAEVAVVVKAEPQGSLFPSNPVLSWKDAEQDVAEIVTGQLKIKGLKKGTTTLVVTVGSESKEVAVTVKSAQGALQKATSIAVDDEIYWTAVAGEAQKIFKGIKSGNTPIGDVQDYTGDVPERVDTGALIVCAGAAAGQFAFKTANGKYLAWTSGNSLTEIDAVDNTSSWTVTIGEDGKAEIKNVATVARQVWYNAGSPRFACYTSKTESDSWKLPVIWK